MRRLSLKSKRKTLETKGANTNSDVKEISDENGGSLESANVNESTRRVSKLRRSRNQVEYEDLSDVDSVNSNSTKDKLNESSAKVGRVKRGRGGTIGTKTEENGDSLDSAAEINARGSKSRRSRGQNEVEVAELPNKRKKRDGSEETSGREVESILAVRTVKNRRRYKVHWRGLPAEEDSWVNENKLSCPEILQDFLRKQKDKKNLPKPLKVDEESEEYEASDGWLVHRRFDDPLSRHPQRLTLRMGTVWVIKTSVNQPTITCELTREYLGQCIQQESTKSFYNLNDLMHLMAMQKYAKQYEGQSFTHVERVIEVRFKKGGKREFLIRWKGFSSNDDTWEPEENLNCPDLISKFLQKLEKAKNVTSRELRANPVTTKRLTLNMKSAQLRYSRRPQTQNRPTYHSYLM